jgi:hypothetical protein
MGTDGAQGRGTRDAPWVLTTPSGGSELTAYRDEASDPPRWSCWSERPRSDTTSGA